MDRQTGEIGARVRAVREGRALTQQEVAERSGLGPEQISRIENGRRRPRAKTLRKLAEALGVAVEKLTGAEELLSSGGPVFAAQAPKDAGESRERPRFDEPLGTEAVIEDRGER